MTATASEARPIRVYGPDQAAAWDDLVARSVNGTILHTRRFLAYHGDRFRDRSVLLTNSRGSKVVGVFPAAEDPADPSMVTSHPGLSYGGLVHDGTLRGRLMLGAFREIAAQYRALGYSRLRYKAMPWIYQLAPGADDQYALSHFGADRYVRDLAAVINVSHRGRVWSGRKGSRKHAEEAAVRVEEGWDDIAAYWRLLEMNLADRHEAKPTHSLAEINYLHEQFPKEIFMITARVGDVLVAGNVFTTEGPVLQGRYTASNEAGRKACASDLVVEHGIAAARERGCQFYSMGTSTLDAGRQLNEPQYDFKISFGGAGVIHETCELDLHRVPPPETHVSDLR